MRLLNNHYIVVGDSAARLNAGLLGADLRIETAEERPHPEKSKVEGRRADNRKALELTGWEPAYAGRAGLPPGLAKTIDRFIPLANLARYNAEIYNI